MYRIMEKKNKKGDYIIESIANEFPTLKMAVEDFHNRYLSLTGREWDTTERDTNDLALSSVISTENVNKDLEMIGPTKRKVSEALASDVRSSKKFKEEIKGFKQCGKYGFNWSRYI
jgi:hypothetical protein